MTPRAIGGTLKRREEVLTVAVQTPSPPPVAPPVEQEPAPVVELAVWGCRFRAWLIDWIILFSVITAIAMAIALPLGDTTGEGAAFLAVGLLIPVAFIYFALLNGRGKTLGKRAQGITVVGAQTLRPIGVWRGALRELVRLVLVPYFIFVIDGLWPLWDARGQSLHDKAARSIVVCDPHEPAPVETPTSSGPEPPAPDLPPFWPPSPDWKPTPTHPDERERVARGIHR